MKHVLKFDIESGLNAYPLMAGVIKLEVLSHKFFQLSKIFIRVLFSCLNFSLISDIMKYFTACFLICVENEKRIGPAITNSGALIICTAIRAAFFNTWIHF